ncbi:hypothetical protein VPH35_129864 [Triticum aestivum]
MPQAATQEGEASGSGPTRALPRSQRSTAAARPTATTRSMALVRARQSPGSQSPLEPTVRSNTRKRKRDPAANRKSKKRKRTGEEEEVSSADSSPVRQPHIPDRMYRLHDLNTSKAIQKAREDVSAKRGGKPLARCCGFWVDWDEKNKIGTALTTSRLICTKSASLDSWSGQEEYDTNAEVLVHMQGGTTEKATLQYHQKHYDLAFFSVRMDRPVHILSFNDGVKRSDHVFELGRDESSFLRISHGVVKFLNPNLLERYHYMHVHSADPRPKYGKGAPLIDFGGKIVGMVNGNTSGSFIPSSILVKCLHLWRKFQRIPRPQLGMKFWSIKFVDIALAENILCKCNIDDGLIVKRVSYGSPAEKLGILVGDVISCFNGEHISTTVELENMMLSKCEDENNSLNSELNVKLDVFHIRKSRWSDRTLTVKVSDDSEVVATGVTYPFVEGTP